MIKVELLKVTGFEPSFHGMRNPKDSWELSDSRPDPCEPDDFIVGEKDLDLALRLADGGAVHAKYRRMLIVYANIEAPLYWWKEFDTYRIGVEKNSCSTMHTLHRRDLTGDDFSYEHLYGTAQVALCDTINLINHYRRLYVKAVQNGEPEAKEYWWQMIQLLPSSFNQKRTVMMNYEVLNNICFFRENHKLDEWREFVKWAKQLPHSELFTTREVKSNG